MDWDGDGQRVMRVAGVERRVFILIVRRIGGGVRDRLFSYVRVRTSRGPS